MSVYISVYLWYSLNDFQKLLQEIRGKRKSKKPHSSRYWEYSFFSKRYLLCDLVSNMGNFSDNELERPCKYQSPGHRLYPHPHRTRKYWIVTFIIHITFLIFSTLMLHHFNQARISQSLLFQPEFNDNDKALFGTPLCEQSSIKIVKTLRELIFVAPLNNKQPYHIESVSTDYWNSRLFFGKPSPESDIAWLSLLSRNIL